MDVVASLYGRNQLTEIINSATKDVFIPITVGGGVRSVSDAEKIFLSGADKVAINTAAVKNPNLIEELSKKFGSQSIVLSVEAKKKSSSQTTGQQSPPICFWNLIQETRVQSFVMKEDERNTHFVSGH